MSFPRWTEPPHWRDRAGPRPVVMVTTSYPGRAGEVPGTFVHTLAKRLVGLGHRVVVVAPAGHGDRRPGVRLRDEVQVRWVGFPGWRAGPFHRDGLPEIAEAGGYGAVGHALVAVPSLLLATEEELKALGPRALAVGHWLVPGGLVAQLAARRRGLGGATTICHSGALRMAARLPSLLSAPLVRLAVGDAPCVVTCRELADILEEVAGVGGDRVLVQPMPVDVGPRNVSPVAPPPYRVLAMGRLVAVKGLEDVIRSLAGVSGIELHVAGDGPLRGHLSKTARELGVRATFHGVVSGSAKDELMCRSHGFVLGSRRLPSGRSEGFPVSMLEALELGLPVMATSVGAVSDLARLGAGLMVVDGPDQMASAWPNFKEVMRSRWSPESP